MLLPSSPSKARPPAELKAGGLASEAKAKAKPAPASPAASPKTAAERAKVASPNSQKGDRSRC
eukprot:8976687-Pyramimonas_sp.AAC.1